MKRGRLDRGGDQRRMAAHLASIPESEPIGVIDHGLALEFLSGRTLQPLQGLGPPSEPRPERFVMTPHTGGRVELDPRARIWLETQCQVEIRFGDYVLYRVVGTYPSDLRILTPRANR